MNILEKKNNNNKYSGTMGDKSEYTQEKNKEIKLKELQQQRQRIVELRACK